MSAYNSIQDQPTGDYSPNYIQHDTSSTNTIAGGSAHNNMIVIVNTGPPESICELPAKKYFVPRRKNAWETQAKPPFCPRVVQRPEFHARSNPRSG